MLAEQAVSLALRQEFSDFSEFQFFRNYQIFSELSDFSEFQIFFFPLLSEGEMKIHLQTKRGLNTLKFGGYSEILTLIHRVNGNPGNNVSIILLFFCEAWRSSCNMYDTFFIEA